MLRLFIALGLFAFSASTYAADWVWIEGERPTSSIVTRHPWYSQVKVDQLSGRNALMHFDNRKQGVASYRFEIANAGKHHVWLRANPIKSSMTVSLNGGDAVDIDFTNKWQGSNIARDNKPDLRFIAWISLGEMEFRQGRNQLVFRMTSKAENHGIIDCIMITRDKLKPHNLLKPNALKVRKTKIGDWIDFDPPADTFKADAALDLRFLNDKVAGSRGYITTMGDKFVYPDNGETVRFWAVNGPPWHVQEEAALRKLARTLAKRGVNMMRWHGKLFDEKTGKTDPAKIEHAQTVVRAMKAEGIYTHFSIYFPLWMKPQPNTAFAGYDGKNHPFATLMFSEKAQEQYLQWWRDLLLKPDPVTGKKLISDPAICGIEIQNEDSLFFWTFDYRRIPAKQMQSLEKKYGDWLVKKYGSLDKAQAAWRKSKGGDDNVKQDAPAEGRMGFKHLWNLSREKNQRSFDQVRFMAEVQRGFYIKMRDELRKMGYKGLITASNWHTANAMALGPLEKWTYTPGQFIDRHGYYECWMKGEHTWSIRNGYTYVNRSLLKGFDNVQGAYNNPLFAPTFANMPQMISEVAANRPNKHRTEFPVYAAALSAIQDNDAIVHFAMDGDAWQVKPRFYMQPWTLMAPTQMGQSPAAALLFRNGLLKPGPVLAEVNLHKSDVLKMKGTPLPIGASLDDLRQKDVPDRAVAKLLGDEAIDPLIQFVGQTRVNFVDKPKPSSVADLSKYIDRDAGVVRSATGEMTLNYKDGVLKIHAPKAEALAGNLKAAGKTTLGVFTVESPMDPGCIIAVSLDDKPLAVSKKILLQVMSEEQPSGWETKPVGTGSRLKIVSIGHDPWQIKAIKGKVSFDESLGGRFTINALNPNGEIDAQLANTGALELREGTIYYLLTR